MLLTWGLNVSAPDGRGAQAGDGTDGAGLGRAPCGGPGETAECGGSMYVCLSTGTVGFSQNAAKRTATHHGAIRQCQPRQPGRHRKH